MSCVFLLEFPPQLPLIIFLSSSDLYLQAPLNYCQIIPVAISESPLLLIQDGLDLFCYPELVIWLTVNSFSRDDEVNTEADIMCYALSELINVLLIRLTECMPVSGLKTFL